ncbi:MAG: xylulokinase [Clostridiales Family XIII bacterium]|jgi:xylulokinase|nr:xylulokinase [Clostridiales Family XIII bacterium]
MSKHTRAVIGIDIGTSGTKTAIFDEIGNLLASHTAEYPMLQPQNGWAEQNPEDWWQASIEGLKVVLAKVSDTIEVVAIGLSGQMHGLVMLDETGCVLRPSIIWCDQRTEREVEQMKRMVGEEKLIRITANPAMTGFTAAKILWVQNNEPDVYAKCRHILLPKDYIRYRLTGEFATEVSDASGMQLMDVGARDWSSEILSLLNIDRTLLAKMYESPEITGTVHATAAAESGLPIGIPVVGGAGDNPAAAVGTGVVSEGRAFTTIGSSAVIYTVSDTVKIDLKGRVHALCASAPGKWTVMSCTQGAGLSLKWFRDNFCSEEIAEAEKRGIDPYILMTAMAEKIPVGSDRLLFLPYLMGERSPHPDPDCRGLFFGLSAIHTRANLIRSVLEGVTFSQLECLNVFREMGVPVQDMVITGGGAKSPFWMQMLADLYGVPVRKMTTDEGAAQGAALLAAVGAGIYPSVQDACATVMKRDEALFPNPEAGKAYAPYFELYKQLYRKLIEEYKTLAKI